MNKKELILNLLDEKLTSQILYTIFVFGSKEGYYFRQSDLEELFYPEVTGNNTVRQKIKKIKPFFLCNTNQNNKTNFHKYDGINENKELNKNENKFKIIKWTSKKTNKGIPLIPSFKWFEILFDIKLNKKEIQILYDFLQSLDDFKEIKNSLLFPHHTFVNLLDIIKEGFKSNYLNYHLGYWIFGDKFNLIKEEYKINYDKEIQLNKKKGYDFIADKNNDTSILVLKKTLKKYNLDDRINTYNINLIITSIYFSNISAEQINDFNKLIYVIFEPRININNFRDYNLINNQTNISFFIIAISSLIPKDQNYPFQVYKKINL